MTPILFHGRPQHIDQRGGGPGEISRARHDHRHRPLERVSLERTHLQAPPVVPKRLWEFALGQLAKIKDRVVTAIENQLKKRPIELLDLREHSDLKFPGDKTLPTRQSFGTLEFRDGSLYCTIRVDEADEDA